MLEMNKLWPILFFLMGCHGGVTNFKRTDPNTWCANTLDNGKCRALLVGVNQYNWNMAPPLKHPEDEAKSLGNFLASQGFESTVITGQSAVPDTIWKYLKKLLLESESKDRLLFYFSGHGTIHALGSKFSMVLFREEGMESSIIPADTLVELIGQDDAHQKIVIFDACYAGQRPNVLNLAVQMIPRYTLSSYGYFGLTTWGGVTYDGEFTSYLMDALRGKADMKKEGNQNGYVDASEIARYVDRRVGKRRSEDMGIDHRPVVTLVGSVGEMELFKVE